MHIIPAIDMKNNQVVRLKQGLLTDSTSYSNSILETAEHWIGLGATRLHLVDLNGAFSGTPFHLQEIQNLVQKFPNIHIQVGGGIRNLETLKTYFDNGVSYCILGTSALKNPDFLKAACDKFPKKIILGVDAKNGYVATEGWADISSTTAKDVIENFKNLALESVVYTDISKDGMLESMNFDQIEKLGAIGLPLIASGGLTNLSDIQKLLNIKNFYGVIAGKALYENKLSLTDAFKLAKTC